ncbi:MAG: hypothetical protein KDA61_22155 [Planctomycetales bacterium]|nr:hypothetical protein [Planctomycetales bacterium]
MKFRILSLAIVAALVASATLASAAQPHFGRMAFEHHTSPSYSHCHR